MNIYMIVVACGQVTHTHFITASSEPLARYAVSLAYVGGCIQYCQLVGEA